MKGKSTYMPKALFYVKAFFYILVGIFILMVSYFAVPVPVSTRQALFPFATILAIAFFIFGVALIFLTLSLKVEKKLKLFLILTGASAACFFLSIILHNFIYTSFIYLFGADLWNKIGLGDEPFFFFLAIVVCPIIFFISVVGSAVLFIKEKK